MIFSSLPSALAFCILFILQQTQLTERDIITLMSQGRTDTLTRTETKTKKAPMFKVLLLNDDYTTWDFVVFVLMKFFGKSEEEAHQGTLEVHQKGIYLAGVYSFEIAETKANQVIRSAQQEGHPFRATVEPE